MMGKDVVRCLQITGSVIKYQHKMRENPSRAFVKIFLTRLGGYYVQDSRSGNARE